MLFFEDQSLTPVQQRDFAARFGQLYSHPFYPGRARRARGHGFGARRDASRQQRPLAQRRNLSRDAAAGGHSLCRRDSRAGRRHALGEHVPRLRDALRTAQRARLAACAPCTRLRRTSRPSVLRRSEWKSGARRCTPSIRRSRIRSRERTRRRGAKRSSSIKISPRTSRASPPRESDALLRFLFEHMAQPEFQVRWRWRAGTVAFWDNRWTQHCALADYFPARRRVRRATILGERPDLTRRPQPRSRGGSGLTDVALIVIGSVIGSGIFRTPAVVAQRIHRPGLDSRRVGARRHRRALRRLRARRAWRAAPRWLRRLRVPARRVPSRRRIRVRLDLAARVAHRRHRSGGGALRRILPLADRSCRSRRSSSRSLRSPCWRS